MHVIFQCPPAGFTPENPATYAALHAIPGIYVYGLKLPIDGENVFIPRYIGISKNLEDRLWQHYVEETTCGNSKKEVFNMCHRNTIAGIINLYRDMAIYDRYRGTNPLRYIIPSLIWFNDSSFFDHRLGLPIGTSHYIANSGVMSSIGIRRGRDLDAIHTAFPANGALNLKNEILCSKALYDVHYYFIYAKLSDVSITVGQDEQLYNNAQDYINHGIWTHGRANRAGKNIAERVEYATKKALIKINIHTTAAAMGALIPMDIDLRNIQMNLVNVGGHAYGNPYINPLVITV